MSAKNILTEYKIEMPPFYIILFVRTMRKVAPYFWIFEENSAKIKKEENNAFILHTTELSGE